MNRKLKKSKRYVFLGILILLLIIFIGGYLIGYNKKYQANITITTTSTISDTTETLPLENRTKEVAKAIVNETKVKEIESILNTSKVHEGSKEDIKEQLISQDYAKVIVTLIDNETFDLLKYPMEERDKVYEQKIQYYYNISNEIIAQLGDNFKLGGITSQGFGGEINKEGLIILAKNPYVKIIIFNKEARATLRESIPLINVNQVWPIRINNFNITGESGNTTICVIDSGINYTHPDLGNCNSTNDINDGSCKKVIGGYNYCVNELCTQNNTNPLDNYGHGTHVAGIATANGSVKGVAFGSKIVAMKVLNSTGSTGAQGFINIQKAIQWCTQNRTKFNISVISMSLSDSGEYNHTTCTNKTATEINDAVALGITVVVASGNNGYKNGISDPACSFNATSVGATYDKNNMSVTWTTPCTDDSSYIDQIGCGTNRGSILDLLAPGGKINSTYLAPSNYIEDWGTSMAAPHVSGLAALMKQTNNSLTPSEIESIMKRTGKPIYDSATKLTFSRIDAYRVVMATLYDVFVSDLNETYTDAIGNKIFSFSIFNDLTTTINVSWSLDIGNGTKISSNSNISLPAYNETFVYVEYFYDKPSEFNVTASIIPSQGTAANQTITIFVSKPNVKVTNLSILNSTGTRRIVEFWIENNSTITQNSIYWQLNRTGEVSINSTQAISLGSSNKTFVYIEFNYTTGGSHNITAIVDYNNTITEINETDNSITISD